MRTSIPAWTEPRILALQWTQVPSGLARQLDNRRVTEDGAEAIALALVSVVCQWVVRRRLQQGEHADWLLRDAKGELVALEVSGIDGNRDPRRLAQKLRQAGNSTAATVRSACVVAFKSPATELATI